MTLTKIIEIENMTPQQSELYTLNRALERLTERGLLLRIHTECRTVATALAEGWAEGWQKSGWKKADGKPVKNSAEWGKTLGLLQGNAFTVEAGKPHRYRMWLMAETERR